MRMEQENSNNTEIESKLASPSLLGMIHQPKEQFIRIRKNPKVIVALIIITVITIITALITLDGMDHFLEEELAGLTDEELIIVTVITQITTVALATIVPTIIILIGATVYFIIAKISERDVTFKQMFSLFTYITFITVIGGLINEILISLFVGINIEIPFTSLNILFGAEGALGILLTSIELFAIWSIILTAIGLQIVAKFSKTLAWGAVIGFNALIIIAGVLLAIVGQSFGI